MTISFPFLHFPNHPYVLYVTADLQQTQRWAVGQNQGRIVWSLSASRWSNVVQVQYCWCFTTNAWWDQPADGDKSSDGCPFYVT